MEKESKKNMFLRISKVNQNKIYELSFKNKVDDVYPKTIQDIVNEAITQYFNNGEENGQN
jgi:DNA-binding protein Fis